jgi:ElaB/YqjD/DUF883 family membrane-anchored ribosome-binding protein
MVRTRPLYVSVTLLLLSALYLLPEIIFNTDLVNVAGGKNSTHEDLKEVEYFGRTISGIGAALLVLDFLLKGKLVANGKTIFLTTVLTFSIVWPTVFFGQRMAIDAYLIDPSSPEQRQQAYSAQLLRSALIENAIKVEGIPYRPDKVNTASEKTFLALLGGLAYADKKLLANFEQQKDEVVKKFVRKAAYSDFDKHYADYSQERIELEKRYAEYRQASDDYDAKLKQSKADAKAKWKDFNAELETSWEKYTDSLQRVRDAAMKQAKAVAPRVFKYHKRTSSCRTQSCLDRANKTYNKEIKTLGFGYIDADYWLIKTEPTGAAKWVNKINSVLGHKSSGITYQYTNDVSHYYRLLMYKHIERFERVGYSFGITTYEEFVADPVTDERAREKLRKQDILLPRTWEVHHKNSFIKAVMAATKKKADTAWKQKMASKGLTLQPYSSWRQFQLSDSVQDELREKLGDYYVEGMLMDWNNKQFLHNVIEPNIVRVSKQRVAEYEREAIDFADGQPMAEEGKKALRAALVPPISMGISLALVLLTLLKLPIKTIETFSPGQKSFNFTAAKHAISIALVGLTLMVPLKLGNSIYTEDGSALNIVLQNVQASSSPLASSSIKWLMHAQPVIEPYGSALKSMLTADPYAVDGETKKYHSYQGRGQRRGR